jgi:hypothetical protein
MKQEILAYFKHDRSLESAIILYNRYGQSLVIKKRFNTEDPDKLIGILHEELRKMLEMPIKEFQLMMKLKVTPLPKNKKPGTSNQKPATNNQKPITINDLPEHVKKTIKLREHFPFLKDPNCPNEAKVLVADMISSYEKYRETHADLFDATSEEDILKACQNIVEPYLENREIWDELEHFKKTGEFLGEYPIFNLKDQFENLKNMDGKKLAKRRETLINGINRNKKDIEKGEADPEQIESWRKALAKRELELVEVDRLLAKK